MSGYTNSQTWEAWFESLEVQWNNTSGLFLVSVLGSLAAIIATWVMMNYYAPPPQDLTTSSHHHHTTSQQLNTSQNHSEMMDHEAEPTESKGMEDIVDEQQVVGPAKRRELEETVQTSMTAQQRTAERDAESQQLAAIFQMMQEQEEKFGETTIDEIKDQMKLYCS